MSQRLARRYCRANNREISPKMCRPTLLTVAAAGLALNSPGGFGLSAEAGSAFRRLRPIDAAWPTAAQWKALDKADRLDIRHKRILPC